ncbi:DNA/RNA non-specific endonuclease [Arthrobacter sp.]
MHGFRPTNRRWERVYARNDIDRGHLVRRTATVWGDTVAEAQQANDDTFH